MAFIAFAMLASLPSSVRGATWSAGASAGQAVRAAGGPHSEAGLLLLPAALREHARALHPLAPADYAAPAPLHALVKVDPRQKFVEGTLKPRGLDDARAWFLLGVLEVNGEAG